MRKYIYFSGVSSNTTGNVFSCNYEKNFLFHIRGQNMISGATVSIQAQSPLGDWGDLDTRSVSTTGTVLVNYVGPAAQTRATITNYVDGTYSVSVDAN
jgi:hypothetical protein